MQDTAARVLSCETMAQDLVRIVLSAPDIAAQAKAGQFIHILVPDSGHVLRRPISLMAADAAAGRGALGQRAGTARGRQSSRQKPRPTRRGGKRPASWPARRVEAAAARGSRPVIVPARRGASSSFLQGNSSSYCIFSSPFITHSTPDQQLSTLFLCYCSHDVRPATHPPCQSAE